MKRVIWGLVIVIALAMAAPYLPAGLLRTRVAAALERSLDRPVEIGGIHFTFFPVGLVPGPGFVFENVSIKEDPRAGFEPFAHSTELGASIRLWSLLRGKLELSGISLGDATINLVKTNAGMWNFQYLLEKAAQRQSAWPAIRMRGGRVNFKFGDVKSIFFFNDADLDIGGLGGVNFGGALARTDQTIQDRGRLFLRGRASDAALDFEVEFEGQSIAANGRLAGALSALQFTGDVEASQGEYRGTLHLRGLDIGGELRGEAELLKARIQLEGLADPLEIESATVSLRGPRVAVDKVLGKFGATPFTGSYNFDPEAGRQHRFNIIMEEAEASELERLLGPALARDDPGFLERNLRLSTPAPAKWLEERNAEGTARIGTLTVGERKISDLRITFEWDGSRAVVAGKGTKFAGEVEIDLSEAAAKYGVKGAEGSAAKLLEGALEKR